MSEDDSSFEGHEFDQPLLDKHKPTRKAPKRGLRNILNLVAFASTYVLVFAGGYLIHQHGYVKCREVYEYDDPNLSEYLMRSLPSSSGASTEVNTDRKLQCHAPFSTTFVLWVLRNPFMSLNQQRSSPTNQRSPGSAHLAQRLSPSGSNI